MNIERLRYVLEVERAGSISQAAENLFMGQPNLSKAIKELENSLGITIFRRTSKGAEITPKGREFLRYARNILDQYEEMMTLGRDGVGVEQKLRVSVPRASYIVNAFTTFLLGLDPEKPIQIDFSETNSLRAMQHVSDGDSSLGIIRCKADYRDYFLGLLQDNGLACRPLLEFEYLVLISKSHPLAAKTVVNREELCPYIEILHGDTEIPGMPRSIAETEWDETPGDKKVRVYERGSQFDILARVPRSYMWVSPMPRDLLRRNGLVQKQCREGPGFCDLLIYRENHVPSAWEEAFISSLEKSIQGSLIKSLKK